MDAPTLEVLRGFPDALERAFAAFPAERAHWTPPTWDGIPSETLTALEQIAHVRDIEIDGYQVRLRRVLAEENPFLPSLDTYALARDRRYGQTDAAAALAAFRAARAETVELVRGLDARALARTGEFEGYGRVTAAALIHYLASHDLQHLSGLAWLRGQIASLG